MTEYFVRQLTPRTYQIAKFEDTKEPTDIYTVTENVKSDFLHCNCQGFRRNQSQDHKHVLMVLAHMDSKANYFDENFNGKVLF